MAYSNCN